MIELVESKVEETEDGLTPIVFHPVEFAAGEGRIIQAFPQMIFEGPYYFAFNSISFLEIRDIRICTHSLTGSGGAALMAETLVKDFHAEIIGKRYFGIAGPIISPGMAISVDIRNAYNHIRKVGLTVYASLSKTPPPYRRRMQ